MPLIFCATSRFFVQEAFFDFCTKIKRFAQKIAEDGFELNLALCVIGFLFLYIKIIESDISRELKVILGTMPLETSTIVGAAVYAGFFLGLSQYYLSLANKEDGRIKREAFNSIFESIDEYNNSHPKQTHEKFLSNIKSSFDFLTDLNELNETFDMLVISSIIFFISSCIYSAHSYIEGPIAFAELIPIVTALFIIVFGLLIIGFTISIRSEARRILNSLEI